MSTKTPQRTSAEHWAWTTQTPLTDNMPHLSHRGNSKFPETLVDNCSTHHHNHRRDVKREAEVEEEAEVEAEVEAEADCLL
jgi:hypothetical protein